MKERNAIQSEQSQELKKHVAVIHSSNKLTLLQRKIANALLFNAYKDLQDKEEHQIHIANLCKLISYGSNDYKTIKKSLMALLSTVLEWNLVDERHIDIENWNASSIIADASIEGAICTYSYSNKMRKLLYHPDMYGRLDMKVQAKFKSSYGLALYENCNRFQDIEQTPWFAIEKFRKLMGVEEGKYKIFRDFKNRVIDKAVEEVNKYSPVTINPRLRKKNRKVISVQFIIKKSQVANQCDLMASSNLEGILQSNFNLSAKQIKNVLKNYEAPYIKEKIQLICTSQSFKNSKISNPHKYLLSALKNNYRSKNPFKKTQASFPSSPEDTKKIDSIEIEKNKRSEQSKAEQYRNYQNNNLMIIFSRLPLREKNKLIKLFEKYMKTAVRGIYQVVYERDGLKNPLIEDQFCIFLRQEKPSLLEKILSFSEWNMKNGLIKF